MSIKLTKHFKFSNKNYIIRKLFLCRECNTPCIPLDFKSFNKNSKGDFLYIATAYTCVSCSKKYITSPSLNTGKRIRVGDNYNTLTDN